MADNYTDATDTNFKTNPYNIDQGKQLSAEGMRAALHTKEKVDNKKNIITTSTDYYPSTKAVYDYVAPYILPIGTILMYDGNGWRDNSTIPGWYICDGQEKTLPNGSKIRTPNLLNKFLRGAVSSGEVAGANSQDITLTTAHLPTHNHVFTGTSQTIYTGDTVDNGTDKNLKTLTGQWSGGEHDGYDMYVHGIVSTYSGDNKLQGFTGDGRDKDNYGFQIDARHAHSISLTPSGTVGNNTGGGNFFTVNTVPAYYSIIYIKKCA